MPLGGVAVARSLRKEILHDAKPHGDVRTVYLHPHPNRNPTHPERNIIMNIEIIELIASALNVITWILLALSL